MRTELETLGSAPVATGAHGRVRQLDGLRAIAIVLVLFHHGLTPLPFGGYVGVDVFFVLSGYLITTLLLREIRAAGTIRFRRFYLRRLIRLYPSLLVVVALLFVPALLLTSPLRGFLLNTVAALTYTTPLIAFQGHAFGPWLHTWSLGVEEIFYLGWPIALLLMSRLIRSDAARVIVVTAVGMAVLVANAMAPVPSPIGEFSLRGGGLFLGCALAMLLARRDALRAPRWAGAVGLGLVLVSSAIGTFASVGTIAVIVAALGSVLLLFALVTQPDSLLVKVLALRPVAYLGLISYEVYLWHYPLLILGAAWMRTDPVHVALVAVPASLVVGAATEKLLRPLLRRLKAAVPY